MKRVVFQLLVVLPFLAAAQPAAPVAGPARDAAGFLVDPAAASAAAVGTSNSAPVVGTQAGGTAPLTLGTQAAGVAPLTSGTYSLDDKHKLLPGDKVSFQIVEDRTNSVPLLVAESSELDIPYVGRIYVAGKTCKELAADLKGLLEKDFYYRATVIIGLDSLSKVLGKVYVWGPVRNQGPIEIPSNEIFTAGKAILRAGGFGDFADKKGVKIVRKTPTGNVTFKVNMKNILENGKTEEDVILEPEDFIIVPQRAINWN